MEMKLYISHPRTKTDHSKKERARQGALPTRKLIDKTRIWR